MNASEHKFQLLFEKSMDPILFFVEGICVDCNDAAIKIMGCNRKDALVGLSLPKMSPAKQNEGESSSFKSAQVF
jgi:PAS domain-containing protein